MINKELVELQKGCKSTCAIIETTDIKELDSNIVIKSNCEDAQLFKTFKEKISKADNKFDYLVIEEIDKLETNKQNRIYQIVKDREYNGILLPENVIIALTVENKEGLKNILPELYHLCVVAF